MNEQAFVMTSDQRGCIQRSKSVCRILVFVCKKAMQPWTFRACTKGILDMAKTFNEVRNKKDLHYSKCFYPLNSGDFVGAV